MDPLILDDWTKIKSIDNLKASPAQIAFAYNFFNKSG